MKKTIWKNRLFFCKKEFSLIFAIRTNTEYMDCNENGDPYENIIKRIKQNLEQFGRYFLKLFRTYKSC